MTNTDLSVEDSNAVRAVLERVYAAWAANEVAVMLATTTAAIKSTLQRARARLDEVTAAGDPISEPSEPHVRALLDQYVLAFESSDVSALEQVLRQDATLEMVPSRTWFAGRKTCVRYITRFLGSPGDWRMVRTIANGQPAVAAYLRGSDGVHHAFGIAVLTATPTGTARIVLFADPELVTRFGLS